jgi:hypothetical protein
MSRPRITKELAGRALLEALNGMAAQSGSADARQLLGAPGPLPPAMAEVERLKREAVTTPPSSSAPAGSKLTPSDELRQVIREELARLLASGKGGKPDGGAQP